MITIDYKFPYSIGQQVQLEEYPKGCSPSYYRYDRQPINKIIDEVYTIHGYEIKYNSNGIKAYYIFNAYCNDFLNYHDRIPVETKMHCVGEIVSEEDTTVHFDVVDLFGNPVELGDCIFYGPVQKNIFKTFQEDYLASTIWSFNTEFEVTEIIYTRESSNFKDLALTIAKPSFKFTGNIVNTYNSPDRYESEVTEYNTHCFKTVPDNFIDILVKSFKYYRAGIPSKEKHFDYDHYVYWLKKYGYSIEEFQKAYKAKNTSSKTLKSKKDKVNKKAKKKAILDDKLLNMISDMSEIDKKKLLEKLNEGINNS